ncbi:MAG: adhesin, partial [Fimbriimonadaceae bacterium]
IKSSTAVGSALKKDVSHMTAFWAQELMEKAKVFPIVGRDGIKRTLTQTVGELDGKQGIYEWIIDNQGNLTHQRFIEGGKITGEPNQK